jgi:hypothetical protein
MLRNVFRFLCTAFVVAAFTQVYGANLVSSTDKILGGIVSGPLPTDTFTVGRDGSSGNTWPLAEAPLNALDGNTATKYLNFAKLNTGFLVMPTVGLSIATGIDFTTANDAFARDPTSFQLFGSNVVSITGTEGAGTTFSLAQFTPITSGALTPPSTGGSGTTNTGRNLPFSISFANSTPYTSYLLAFPTVRDSVAANSMQIGDAVLTGNLVPEPGILGLLGLTTAGVLGLRRRR